MAPKKNYSREQMAKAIEEVRLGEKVAVAAAKNGVPRVTLRNKTTGKSPEDCNMGPNTILTKDEEITLVNWILYMADNHFPVTKDQLLDSVQKIVMEKNLETSCPFTNKRPGKKWYSSFLKRHPEIAPRTAQNLTKARGDVTEDELTGWFSTNTDYLKNRGLYDVIMNEPRRVFNTDESAFFLHPKPGRVLVRKGEKNVYNSSGDGKENLTVLITANAAGELAPPMIVFPYERLPTVIANSVPTGWAIGRSDTGWMCARTFFEYVCNVFNPWLDRNNVAKPIVFFLDGHRSHMTLHLSDFCKDNGIEIIALYPNSTHLLQPMDIAVFRPLKMFWKNQVSTWKTENPEKRLKKENFAQNLEAALVKVSAETIKNEFRKSGLHPFGPEYVDMFKISVQNRTEPAESRVIKKSQFMKTLESEIKSIFSHEKLTFFNLLYYMPRNDVNNLLPNEDQSLYIIWAKTKNILGLGDNEQQNILEQNTRAHTTQDQTTQEQTRLENNIQRENTEVTTTQSRSIQGQVTPEQNIPGPNIQEKNAEEYSVQGQIIQGHFTAKQYIQRPNEQEDNTQEYNIGHNAQGQIMTKQNTQGSNVQGENKEEQNAQEHIMTEQNTQQLNDEGQNIETIIDHPTGQGNKEQTFSAAYSTPRKSVNTNLAVSYPSTSTTFPKDVVIPSPFKRALFWPEPEIKKRRTKERVPSAITSDTWRDYMKKKESEKKKKQDEKEKRIKERKYKKMLKEKMILEKKKLKQNKKIISEQDSSSDDDMEVQYAESDDSEYAESEKSDSENEPLSNMTSNKKTFRTKGIKGKKSSKGTKGSYVIVKYEGEYFPGRIDKTEKDLYEISTMVLSAGNSFRWPDKPDKIWYRAEDVIEKIGDPLLLNKRGFYKITEMGKYLPDIYNI